MLNQVILVGRLTDDPKINSVNNGKKVSTITLAVGRSFKNADGIASNTHEYCKKGDVVGVKGRLQVDSYENKDGEKRTSTNVIAEKVTFLSHSDNNKEDANS